MEKKVLQTISLTNNSELPVDQQAQLAQLVDWLGQTDQRTATMQELKRQFPKWQGIEQELDVFVKQKLISRTERRYASLIPCFTTSQLDELVMFAQKISATLIATNELVATTLNDAPWLVSLASYCLSQEVTGPQLNSLPTTDYRFLKVAYLKTDHYLFVDTYFTTIEEQGTGLACYFSELTPSLLSDDVYNIIGDVNPDFFLEMTGKQLELLADNQQPQKTKQSIFLDVLMLLGYAEETAGKYQLQQELKRLKASEIEHRAAKLKQVLSSLIREAGQELVKEEERALLKSLLLNELLQKQGPSQTVVLIPKD